MIPLLKRRSGIMTFRPCRRAGLAAALAVTFLAACAEERSSPPRLSSGQVILVVEDAGAAADPRLVEEGLYALHDIALDSALGLSRADLSAMSWRQIRADFPQGAEPRAFEGPRLSHVLSAAGHEGAGARLTAFDGYQAEVSAEMIASHEPILALRADGQPMSVGGLGPVMLVWPRLNQSALSGMNDDLWPWGVFAITPLDD
jgi:hypothetical protein